MDNSNERPQKLQPKHQPDTKADVVPLIPPWVMDGWGIILAVAGVVALLEIVHIGHVYGAGYGWALVAIVACAMASLWWQDYGQRRRAAQSRIERALYEQHQLAAVDVMTGRDFECYCVWLLEALGHREVVHIGSTEDDDGADIIATAPDGTLVAVQCKRWKGSVGRAVVDKLIGALIAGRHRGRAGMVLTNAAVTSGAHTRARAQGITVVDRPVLQQWMSQARALTEQHGNAPGAYPVGPSRGLRPAAKVTVGILSTGVVLLTVIALQHPHAATAAARPRPPAAAPAPNTPRAVVERLFTAINHHNWPAVWRLSHHPPGSRPQYHAMIAGYRLTERDVVTALHAQGDIVAASVLAYDTTGATQTFQFRYTVHAGMITSGSSILLSTTLPPRKLPVPLTHHAQP
ncbi:MAG TPA: restriction endonuclease [Streptosporangiaceae bacterium]|nr:restriction endonuclease [Streptosporangiaceae bacterium]